MRRLRSITLPMIGFSFFLASAAPLAAQSMPRIPGVRLPQLPSTPVAPPVQSPASQRSANSGELIRDFVTEAQQLTNPIDGTTVNEADNRRVDRDVEAYRAIADKMSGGRYEALPPAQKQPMLQGLKGFYDMAAASTDGQIEEARRMIKGVGRGDAAYNFLIIHDSYLYAAEQLFPGDRTYTDARSKLAGVLSELGGSRAGAVNAEEEAALAAARKVRMPAAITSDRGAQALFRQAWRTSGIPWEIMKINVTSGWRDKVENGRVIGQRRDAAIAARDPNNPDRCNLYDFTMFRDRSGAVRRDSHSTKRIACENVN